MWGYWERGQEGDMLSLINMRYLGENIKQVVVNIELEFKNKV